jgi:lambda family phage portal protein
MSLNTSHTAADTTDSRLAAWTPPLLSADADVYGESSTITARARDLVRNYPVAAGARRTLIDNVVSSQLKLSAKPEYILLGQDKEWAYEWARQWEAEFGTWANTTECDAARTQNFLGLTRQAVSGMYVNGDHFGVVQWLPCPDAKWSTRIQSVEADRVATPPWLSANLNIRDGVEVDQYGAPMAYWICKVHPGDTRLRLSSPVQTDWVRVDAFTSWGRRRVIHLFDKERAGQTRGKSIFAPVMRELKVSWDYLSSELQAAAVNSLVAFFLESDLSQEEVSRVFGATAENSNAGNEQAIDERWKEIAQKMHRKKLEGGMINSLPLGAKVHPNDFSRPNTSFDPFMEVINRLVGVGINLPFELINNNFSKTNYSSARAALAEAWRYFLCERSWIETGWLNPVLESVMEESLNKGRIDAPDFYAQKHAYTKAKWIYAGRGAIDPYKEARAITEQFANKSTTLEKVCADNGEDWEDVAEQQQRERTYYGELGMPSPYDEPQPAANVAKPDPELNDESGNPKDDDSQADNPSPTDNADA